MVGRFSLREIDPISGESLMMNAEEVNRLPGLGGLSAGWVLIKKIIQRGLGSKNCPVDSDLATLIFGGSVAAALTGECLALRKAEKKGLAGRVYYIPKAYVLDLAVPVFNQIRRAQVSNPGGLDVRFVEEMLKLFFPRLHHPSPDDPYRESDFAVIWRNLPIDVHQSLSLVRIEWRQEDHKVAREWPVSVYGSIAQTVKHVPTMVDLTAKWLSR
ncbi:hypothetical protein KGQ31_03555 [Patescibacteria group bacterium]|nr:hypothetical protein [Patescibacteria group bacterium]